MKLAELDPAIFVHDPDPGGKVYTVDSYCTPEPSCGTHGVWSDDMIVFLFGNVDDSTHDESQGGKALHLGSLEDSSSGILTFPAYFGI